MRFTCILIGILCLLCLFNHGNTTLDAQQTTSIQIEQPYLDPNWRPEAGYSLTFEIRVTVPADFSSGTLIAVLQNVTNYAGKSGNVAVPSDEGGNLAADLKLHQTTGWSGSESQLSYTLSGTTASHTVSLQVNCKDYAAYGELKLTASGSGYTSNEVVIKIPKDDNGNKIADGWQNDVDENDENRSENYDPDADADSGPNSNSNFGDGITVINEYRGLNVSGTWTDTDPNGWDVFIRSKVGSGDAGALPMTVHDMSETEVSWITGRVYPFGIGSQKVYAIRLGDTADERSSETTLGSMRQGPTHSYSTGWVDVGRIEEHVDNTVVSVNERDFLDGAIAHEIGHAVNLSHCPDIDCPNCYMWRQPDWPMAYVTQFAAHHNSDYDLTYDGHIYLSSSILTFPDRGYSSNRGVHIRQVEDVNGDGVINISDLTIVASKLGSSWSNNHPTDVNSDSSTDISDLMLVAQELGNTATEFPHLPEDVNDDRVVNILDLLVVSSNLGQSGAHAADVNCDGTVDILDLVRVVSAFGMTVAPEE